MIGLLLGAILGPPIQKGLALVSLRLVVPLALASLALGLFARAVARTVGDLRRADRVLRQD